MTMNYKEHEEIVIPDWLTTWEDFSWHNDAMPHSVLFFKGEEGPNVECWVNYENHKDREVPPRFEVIFRATDNIETGSDETLFMGEDESGARLAAKAAELARDIITAGKLHQPVPWHGNPYVYRILTLWMQATKDNRE